MRKKVLLGGLVAVLLAAGLAPAAAAEAEATAQQVTHAELARLLVKVLGLARYLSATPTDQECFAVLLANGVTTWDGWSADKVVTKADLAKVTVLAMGRGNEVQNPDDPKSWIDFLQSIGVPVDTIGLAMDSLKPLPQPVAINILNATVDPLKTPKVSPEPDAPTFGADAALQVQPITAEEFNQFVKFTAAAVLPPPRPPVTPT